MGVHVYCIVARDHRPGDGLRGVAGVRVAAAETARLTIWYSEHDAPPPADASAVRAHHVIVDAAMTPELTPLPVRFGEWFASVDAALEQVGAEEAKWLELLARFAGCAEYGVRIHMDTGAPARDVRPIGVSGTAYMTALARRLADAKRRRAEGEAIAMRVHDALTGVVVDARVEIAAAGCVSLAHLVAHRREGEYHSALLGLRRAHSEVKFSFTGPWPPYSFVA